MPEFKAVMKKFDEAGINYTEAAKLCHVTRQTLYNWKNGKPVANEFLYKTACFMADLAEKATVAGLLPLDPEVSVESRVDEIKKVLQKVR